MSLSLYIHIPFCIKKCKYCNFYSIEVFDKADYFEIYVNSLIKEIEKRLSKLDNFKVKSIYFGGGTPSLLNERFYEKIFNKLNNFFNISSVKEITIEANPETVLRYKFNELKKLGINRVSLGVQTFNDQSLSKLGRIHNCQKIFESMEILNSIYENINIDLIFGIPGEDFTDLENSIIKTLNLKPKHISIYNLEYYKGSELFEELNIEKIYRWSDIKEKNGYLLIRDLLVNNGYTHYEISNFSLHRYQSIHNLNYWLGGEYIGFGPYAYSFFKKSWYKNGNLYFYLNTLKNNELPILKREILSKSHIKKLLFILNLRLLSGANLNKYKNFDDEFYKKLNSFINKGLMVLKDNKIKLSIEGILVSNIIFQDLL